MSEIFPAQTHAPRSAPDAAHKRLEAFVGRWSKEGQAYDSLFGPAANVTAVETYEWLHGGFFLVHRLDGRLGDHPIACVEIIGYEPSTRSYPVRSFYDDGSRNEWRLGEHGGIWTLTGEWKVAGEVLQVRCTMAFEDGGGAMTQQWEYSSDGASWQVFWETRLTRA